MKSIYIALGVAPLGRIIFAHHKHDDLSSRLNRNRIRKSEGTTCVEGRVDGS